MTPDQIKQLAEQRRAQLARLQPLKQDYRQRADELRGELHTLKQEGQARAEEREIVTGHPFDLFVTPPALATRMVLIAKEHTDQHTRPWGWLEPSAGTGNIVRAIREEGASPHCVELNHSAAELLRRRHETVTECDFLEYHNRWDVIVMNPPFSNNQDIRHIRHAYDILNPGGIIVAIMGEHAFFASDKESTAFRAWFPGTSEQLPPGTFKPSGTMVNARLVIIRKENNP